MSIINAAPLYNMHTRTWDQGECPELAGPIELYDPCEAGTEEMDDAANFECEYRREYDTLQDAIDDIHGEMGRFLISTADNGHYLGFLNHVSGSVAVVIY